MSEPTMNNPEVWMGILFMVTAISLGFATEPAWNLVVGFTIGLALVYGRISYLAGYYRAKVEEFDE